MNDRIIQGLGEGPDAPIRARNLIDRSPGPLEGSGASACPDTEGLP